MSPSSAKDTLSRRYLEEWLWLCQSELPPVFARLQQQLQDCQQALSSAAPPAATTTTMTTAATATTTTTTTATTPATTTTTTTTTTPTSRQEPAPSEIYALSVQTDAMKGYIGVQGDSIMSADIHMKLHNINRGHPCRITLGAVAQYTNVSKTIETMDTKTQWNLPQVQTAKNLIVETLQLVNKAQRYLHVATHDDPHVNPIDRILKTILRKIQRAIGIMITPPLTPTPKAGVAPFVSPVRIMEALYDDSNRNCLFEPPLPNDMAMEFYLKDTKIVCAVYALQYQDISQHPHHMAPALANGLKDIARPFETIGGRIQHMFQVVANNDFTAQHAAVNISAESITSLHQDQAGRSSSYRAGVLPLSELRAATNGGGGGGYGKSDSDGTVHPLTQSVTSDQQSNVTNTTVGSHATMHDPQETGSRQSLPTNLGSSVERRRSVTSPPTATSDLMLLAAANQPGSSSLLRGSGGVGGPGNKENNLQQQQQQHHHHSHHGDVGGGLHGGAAHNAATALSLLGLHGLGGGVPAAQLQWFPFRGRLCAVTAEHKVEFAYGKGRLSSVTKVTETLKLVERLCMEWTSSAAGKLGAFSAWIQEREEEVVEESGQA